MYYPGFDISHRHLWPSAMTCVTLFSKCENGMGPKLLEAYGQGHNVPCDEFYDQMYARRCFQ